MLDAILPENAPDSASFLISRLLQVIERLLKTLVTAYDDGV
jgi:hypothetical protein